MDRIRIITLFELILIVLFTPAIMAQNEYRDDSSYDYGSAESYKEADFYTQSDPNQWDYSKVAWGKVDFGRQDLYNSNDFYKNIPNDRYDELDYTKVDYSKISDHSKIDASKYFADTGCSSCSLDRGNQNLRFSKEGITHPKGGFVSVPGNYPPSSLFIATEEKIIVVLAESVAGLEVPSKDNVVIDTNGQDSYLADGTKINGKVSYQNGITYVAKGDKALINDVEITASYNKVDVYFDGKEHSGNYISFGEKNVVIQGDNFDAGFKEGNRYVNVNSEENDRFSVRPLNNGKVTITNREEQNLAPNVVVTGPDNEEEWARIKNGNFDGFFGKNGVVEADVNSMLKNNFGSVPMEIGVVDQQGNNLIKSLDGKEGKLIITNDNKVLMVNPSTIINYDGSVECGSSGSSSITGNVILLLVAAGCLFAAGSLLGYAAVDMDHNEKRPELIDYLQKNFGKGTQFNIEFVDIDQWSYSELKYVQDNLYKLYEFNPNLLKSINNLKLVDNEHMAEKYDIIINYGIAGYASETERLLALDRETILVTPSRFAGMAYPTLVHETAHRYHQNMNFLEKQRMEQEWYKATDVGDTEKGASMYHNKYGLKSIFIKKYDLSDGGWLRDYGQTNIQEDIATMVEVISTKGIAQDLISNPHYRQKVSLLCQYGFLSGKNNLCK